ASHTQPLTTPSPYSLAKSGKRSSSKRASIAAPSLPIRALPPPRSVPLRLVMLSVSIETAVPSSVRRTSTGSYVRPAGTTYARPPGVGGGAPPVGAPAGDREWPARLRRSDAAAEREVGVQHAGQLRYLRKERTEKREV